MSGLFRGAAATTVAVAAVGCVDTTANDPSMNADGATEVLPRSPGLWYFNALPTRVPAVRSSAPVAPDWSTSKQDA